MIRLAKRIVTKPYHFVRSILNPMPSKLSNVEYNKVLWNRYAEGWKKKQVYIEDTNVRED